MNKDFTVSVNCYAQNMRSVGKKTYDFSEYAEMIGGDLKRIIADVEDVFYRQQDGRSKEDWDESALLNFDRIRRKLLDSANAVCRLPKTLNYKGVPCDSMKASEMLAKLIDG